MNLKGAELFWNGSILLWEQILPIGIPASLNDLLVWFFFIPVLNQWDNGMKWLWGQMNAVVCFSAATDNKDSKHCVVLWSQHLSLREWPETADSLHTADTWADHSLTNHSIKLYSWSQQSMLASSCGMWENRIIIQEHRRGYIMSKESIRFLSQRWQYNKFSRYLER